MKKFIAFVFLFVLAFTVLACTPKDTDVKPTGLKIKITSNEIEVDEIITAKLTWEPSDVTNTAVTWSSSDESVATVKNGKITGVAPGTAKITAVSDANSKILDSVDVIVRTAEKEPSEPQKTTIPTEKPTEPQPTEPGEKIYCTSIQFLNVIQTTYYVNESVRFGYTLNNDNTENVPTDNTVRYESSDEDIATVSEYGTITFISDGEVTIKIIANGVEEGKEGTIFDEITLTALPVVNPTKLNATISSPILDPGYTTKVTVSVEPENGDRRVTFTSSNETIATVDENGNVTTFADVSGQVVITVASVADPSIFAEVDLLVQKTDEILYPESIEIKGETTMFVGNAYSIRLTAVVLPATAFQGVEWSSNNESIAIVDDNGLVTGISPGRARIKATSTIDESIKSSYFNIDVTEYVANPPVDLGGYEIVFMNAASALGDIDPFLDSYTKEDKAYKQEAWREVESDFNCTIVVKPYPDEAPWGPVRRSWLITNATNGTSECDLATIESSWVPKFVAASSIIDLTDFYAKYGESQMENATKEAGSFNNKLYIASTGISPVANYVGLGLYYNMALIEKYNLEDPATMFNEGTWTYSGFTNWVRTAQAGLGNSADTGMYAIGGHAYYWWFGLTNAAGVKICDTTTMAVSMSTQRSKDAASMYYSLVQEGCVDPRNSWCESSSDGNAFFQGKSILTTGHFWFLRGSNRWYEGMFGDDTRFGYVPFPYPDGMDKEQTRISVGSLSAYIYMAGRTYPAGITTENIYHAVNAMFLNTIKKQKADPLFDAATTLNNALIKKLDNPESIKAVQFFTASKVFFDPTMAVYESVASSPVKSACIEVFTNGKNYDEIFASYYSTLVTDFIAAFSA